ncbi:hypothetical protein TVAG_404390 [Trichomonas vaginalis G3]|uniref:Initiator binding domain-containing protein n=1 Tax=Trichomonas vaginalis (strain ATCC PRA-98 / G3) TaxID=412133 RepID=A2EGI8_TRIV3|nr:transcription-initiator DNA-binding domain ibd family [Trichomonas vaginalis G3]EAY08271.1 hypothetical protein TVAG_404390 [Trichomonas vaginalis G3]KAI5507487.1 transcription-initiator DNA-binding domain ibd family [Trichomonas vaginalis G3]|eukprot:XP_001320494.1 hypothetical protein [Trichomonas vaginalis G3]
MSEISAQPKYIEMLSEADRKEYNNLRSMLSSNVVRNRRGKRVETFAEILTAIKNFCIKGDGDDWKRCLVCGVCWLPAGIAINNRQFQILIDKCKSSINGSLQRMGYGTIQSRQESIKLLSESIPLLAQNYPEAREWSVRQYIAATPQPSNPSTQFKLIPQFNSPAPQIPNANNVMHMPTQQFYEQLPPQPQQEPPEDPYDPNNDFGNFSMDPNYNPFDEYDPYSLEQTFPISSKAQE